MEKPAIMTLDANLQELAPTLEAIRSQGVQHHIGGNKTASRGGKRFDVHSPVDGSLTCQVAAGSRTEIDSAASAAKEAFGHWSRIDGSQRSKILHRIADLLEQNARRIGLLESWDTGQPIRFMSKTAARGAHNFRYFADKVLSARDGQSLPSPTLLNLTTRMPIGPVGVITPWNVPFMLSTWKIAPALAAGCTVVHKPAELSPLTAEILVELCEEAGLPAGALNVVHGTGSEAGVALTEHPDIRAIAFVGESATGSDIMRQGSATLKRVHFELGGKNPVIVFEDADLDRALDAVIFMIFSLNGERCTSSSRLLVEEGIAEEFVARLKRRIGNLRIGNPLDPATEIGPLISEQHVEKVLSYVKIAHDEGATVAAGGRRLAENGCYVLPTLLCNATSDMRIAQEEIFGPVLTVIPFADEEQALTIANDVRYGLAGYVWTSDLERALRVSDNLQAGMIWVNSHNVRHLPTPFGGMKDSGIGRDGGDWSFEFYMERKHIALATGKHPIPRLGGN